MKYAMKIIETLSRTVIVDADDLDEATNKVIIAPISTKGQKRFKKYKNPFNIFILSVSS